MATPPFFVIVFFPFFFGGHITLAITLVSGAAASISYVAGVVCHYVRGMRSRHTFGEINGRAKHLTQRGVD